MVKSYKLLFKQYYKPYLITAAILFSVFFIYYTLILYLHISTDVQVHANMAFTFFTANGSITPNFLYYFLVALAAGFSKHKMAYYIASVILLSLAIAFKFLVNAYYLKRLTGMHVSTIIFFSIAMLFVFCLPGVNFFHHKDFYLGQLAPNVWHNSTVLFLAPFSIILFFETLNFINKRDCSRAQQILIFSLVVLNAFIKPSFLFTIIPLVFLWLISNIHKIGTRQSFQIAFPYLAGFLFIILEYFLIYKSENNLPLPGKESSSVIFSPFEMWSHFSANMPVALVTSCLFPVIYVVYTKGSVFKNQMVSFAGLNFLFALLIWILFIETGFRRYHGNFYWQLVIANYLLFFSMLIHLLQQSKNHLAYSSSKKIIFAVFGLHFIWGLLYWIKIIWFHGYS